MLELVAFPDWKLAAQHLTIGKSYQVLRTIGNGVVIAMDNETEILILRERFR